jgi:hypothetical protein
MDFNNKNFVAKKEMISQPGKILTAVFADEFPQFERKKELKPGYWFIHGPQEDFYSTLIVMASKKYQCFEVDVYCGVFPVWDRQYGSHQLRSSTGLPNLRENSGMVNMEEVAYTHDGSELGVRRTISTIVSEIRTYAFPWFEKIKTRRKSDFLMDYGLRWIDAKKDEISSDIDSELQEAFKAAEHVSWKVEHPILNALRHDLRIYASEQKASKKMRQETSILALDLLSFAGLKKKSCDKPGT